MDIFVINLERSKDRLEKINEQMSKYGITYKRFNAIDGSKLSKEEIQRNTSILSRNLFINKSILGCAMSHIAIWKQFLNSNNELICVMEDDAIISPQFLKFIQKDVFDIYNDLDFDYLNLHCGGIYESLNNEIYINDYIINKPVFGTLATCYILSKNGCKKLLEYFNRVDYHIDVEISVMTLLKDFKYFSIINPTLVTSNFTDTTLNTDHKGILSQILVFLKMYKLLWILNTPVISINMNINFTVYKLLLIILLIILLKFKYYILSSIILIELILIFI